MSASLLVFVPVALFVLVASLCFVGCYFDVTGLPLYTEYTNGDILPHPALVAYWPLGEAAGAVTAVDLKGTAVGTPHNGTYTSVDTAPALFPCPAFELAPGVNSAAAPGTLTLGTEGIVPGDIVQPEIYPLVRTTAMQCVGGFVTVPVNSVINPPGPFTVEAWIRPEWDIADPPAFHVFIDAHDNGGTDFSGFALSVNQDGNWEATLGTGGTNFISATAGRAALSATTHVVLTFDGTNAALFTDGTRMSPVVPVPAGQTFTPNTTVPLVIGVGLPWLPPRTMLGDLAFFPLLPFKGKIQDIAIYNAVLTDAEIETHRNHGNGVDPTPP